jgi:hypothetical protein
MQNENDLIRMRFSSKELSSHSAKYKFAIDERDRDRQLPDRFLSIMSSICRVILTFKSVSATSIVCSQCCTRSPSLIRHLLL